MAPAPHWPQMTGQAISDFIGVSPRWLAKLEEQGFIKRGPDRLYDGGAVLLGYVRWLKDDSRRSSKTEGAKLKEAEQLRKLRIENARALNELVEMDVVETAFAEIFTMLRSEIGAVPAGITRDPVLRADLEKRHNAAFDRCGAKFAKTRAALQSGQPVLDGDEDAEP